MPFAKRLLDTLRGRYIERTQRYWSLRAAVCADDVESLVELLDELMRDLPATACAAAAGGSATEAGCCAAAGEGAIGGVMRPSLSSPAPPPALCAAGAVILTSSPITVADVAVALGFAPATPECICNSLGDLADTSMVSEPSTETVGSFAFVLSSPFGAASTTAGGMPSFSAAPPPASGPAPRSAIAANEL